MCGRLQNKAFVARRFVRRSTWVRCRGGGGAGVEPKRGSLGFCSSAPIRPTSRVDWFCVCWTAGWSVGRSAGHSPSQFGEPPALRNELCIRPNRNKSNLARNISRFRFNFVYASFRKVLPQLMSDACFLCYLCFSLFSFIFRPQTVKQTKTESNS